MQGWGEVNEAKLRKVGMEINGEEIRKAFFQIVGFKAPGCDGSSAVFYH